MNDLEKTKSVEMVFELGKLTRRALIHCNDDAFRVELSKFSMHLRNTGQERIAQDMLSVFIAGFHEEELEGP